MTRSLLLAVALLSACVGKTADTAPPAAGEIAWQAWSADAFARAAREDRMIIVDVGIEGCTACRWMEQKTYGNPEVAALVEDHFVAISVDAEARPDIGERYEYWAWPATIFMSPQGEQVLAIRGNKLPKNFLPILHELIEAKRAGTLTGDNKHPITAPPRVLEGPLEELRKDVVARMDPSFDEKLAGWGRQKAPAKAHLRHAFLRAHARDETVWRDNALRTLEAMTTLIDPEWGGIFVASFEGWHKPVPEKRIAGQAAALQGFATAYRLTGDAAWKTHAAAVDRYVKETLQADDGTFYTSQEDVAPKLPASMSAAEYYALPGDERLAYGTPPVDHGVYTDKNALMIRSYVTAGVAIDPAYLAVAERAARQLAEERQTDAGWFRQWTPGGEITEDDRMRALPATGRAYLRPQGPMGLALLDLYAATGDRAWLQRAEKLAAGLAVLADDVGGFFDTDDDSTAHVAPRRKSVEANAQAGQFLYLLSIYTKNKAYREAADKTARAVAHPNVLRREGRIVADLAILLDLLVTGYVEFTVVGESDALVAAARAVYEPRKVLHSEAPGRYPDQGRPALFICNDNACSPPITDPAKVEAAAARFAGLSGS